MSFAEFRVQIEAPTAVAWQSMAEAVSMYSGAWIERLSGTASKRDSVSVTVHSAVQTAEFTTLSPKAFLFVGRALCENTTRLLAEHYGLIFGLRRSGLEVDYSGTLAKYLPAVARPSPPRSLKGILFERVFQDHVPQTKRPKPLSESELQELFEVYEHASTLPDLPYLAVVDGNREQDGSTALSIHGKNVYVEVQAVDGKVRRHRIKGFSLNEISLEHGLRHETPALRRTWGEAWIGHDVQKQTLVGLSIFDEEICLITHRAYRYKLFDMDSVKRRQITFGTGKSEVFTREQWIEFSRHYHELRNALVAMRCLEQAELLSANAEQKLQVQELRKVMRPKPKTRVPDEPSLRLRPMADLESLVSKAFLEEVSAFETERYDAYVYSDYGRTPWDVAGSHPVDPEDKHFKTAGFTQQILAKLMQTKAIKTLPEQLPELFVFEVAGRRVWGGRTTGIYYVEGIPHTVFGAK